MASLTFDALHPILGVVVSLKGNAACVCSSAVHSLIGMARSHCLDHGVARQAQKKRKGLRVRASTMLGVVYLMHLAFISLVATVLSLDMCLGRNQKHFLFWQRRRHLQLLFHEMFSTAANSPFCK